MDEELLQQSLEQYKEQFLQIQTVLQSTGEEGQDELVKLRDDLVELIHVSEESLLSLKKSRLLQLLDNEEVSLSTDSSKNVNDSIGPNDNEKDTESLDDEDSVDTEDDITGMKCRISYTQEWGVTEHHNAMVFDAETFELHDGKEETKVRVLFMNPTHKSMVPCPYFLDSKCKFNDDTCRYSHGYVVSVEDLMPFKEPDFSQVQCDHSCLARYDDGVWYKATIQSIDHDAHTFVVHYDTYNSDATLGIEAVLPLDQRESENVSDNDLSSSSDSEESRLIEDIDEEEIAVVRLSWKPTGGPLCLGEWEQHTKGIGSKLMAKMGYIFGKGLGKDGSGIVEPVEAVVLPQGKSLDRIAELRENNKLPKPGKKKKQRASNKVKNAQLPVEASGGDVFDFINTKLGGKRGNIHDIRVPVPGTSAADFEVKETGKKKKGDDKNVNWNLQLFKTQEEISAVKKQLKKEEMALSRHKETDAKAASHFRQKVTVIKAHLSRLHEREKDILQKLHHKKNHRKLTVF